MILLDNFTSAQINQDNFNTIFSDMKKNLGCEYLLYSVENMDRNLRHVYTTNQNWQDMYINQNLIQNCALVQFGKEYIKQHNKAIILPWGSLQPSTKAQKYVIDARKSFNIGNGISFGQKFLGFNEYIGVCGNINDDSFATNILSRLEELRKYIRSFRTISFYLLAMQRQIPVQLTLNLLKSQANYSHIGTDAQLLTNNSLIDYLKFINTTITLH